MSIDDSENKMAIGQNPIIIAEKIVLDVIAKNDNDGIDSVHLKRMFSGKIPYTNLVLAYHDLIEKHQIKRNVQRFSIDGESITGYTFKLR